MTTAEVFSMLQSVGIPVAYLAFEEGTQQRCPFLCFYYPQSDNEDADNITWSKVEQLEVELYCNEKRFDLEKKLEQAFTEHGLAYDRAETYISGEKMIETIYSMEVLIDG